MAEYVPTYVRSVSGTWHVLRGFTNDDYVTTQCHRMVKQSAFADTKAEVRSRIRGGWHRKWCCECPWREHP